MARKAKDPKEKNLFHLNCQKIVSILLRKDVKPNWAREIKIAKQLLKEYPYIAEWTGIPENNRVYSLAFFLTDFGKKFLVEFQRTRNFEFQEVEQTVSSNEIIGENKEIIRKPRTLLEFLNHGKN